MKQNHWTIKYRSLTYIYLMRSISVSHWSIIPTMMFIHQIILKILSKITKPWNTGHVDLYLFSGQSLGHTVSLSENMTLIHHHIVLEISGKITGPWNIGQSDLHLFLGQMLGHTDSWSQIVMFIHQTVFKIKGKITGPWNIGHKDLHLFRSNVWSYWLTIPKYEVHTSYCLQEIRQKQWTMKYRSQWPTFISR